MCAKTGLFRISRISINVVLPPPQTISYLAQHRGQTISYKSLEIYHRL